LYAKVSYKSDSVILQICRHRGIAACSSVSYRTIVE